MSRQTTIAAVLLPALLALAPAFGAEQPAGMVVARDLQTGQLRAPTPAELHALQGRAAAVQTTKPKLTTQRRSDGRGQLHLGERAMVYTVVTRDAAGQPVMQCLHGAQAAEAARAAPMVQPSREHDHDVE